MKVIICAQKSKGKDHVRRQIDAYFAGSKLSDVIVGFDLVHEEDSEDDLADFLPEIYEARSRAEELGLPFNLYLHAG